MDSPAGPVKGASILYHHSQPSRSNLQTTSSPMHTLPDEVLSEIFEWCLPFPFDSTSLSHPIEDFDSLSSHHPPWTMSQVNRHWRAIALSHPRLWSVIVVFITGKFEPRPVSRYTNTMRLKLQLERSRPCDISVTISGKIMHSNGVLEILREEIARWRVFRADIPFISFITSPPVLLSTFPTLSSLILDLTLARDLAGVDLYLSGSTQLTSYKQISGPKIDVHFSKSKLKSFHMVFANLSLLPRLSQATYLEELHIEDSAQAQLDPSLSSSSPIILPSLRSMTIKEYSRSHSPRLVKSLLECIRAPALTSLHMVCYGTTMGPLPMLHNPDVLTHFVLLHISDDGDEEADSNAVLEFLRSTRNVESFTLNCGEVLTESIIRALHIDDELDTAPDNILLPRLSRLQLDDDSEILEESPSDVVRMVVSRGLCYVSGRDVAWCAIAVSEGQVVHLKHEEIWESVKREFEQSSKWGNFDTLIQDGRPLFIDDGKLIPPIDIYSAEDIF